jgi:hypothetical protein
VGKATSHYQIPKYIKVGEKIIGSDCFGSGVFRSIGAVLATVLRLKGQPQSALDADLQVASM